MIFFLFHFVSALSGLTHTVWNIHHCLRLSLQRHHYRTGQVILTGIIYISAIVDPANHSWNWISLSYNKINKAFCRKPYVVFFFSSPYSHFGPKQTGKLVPLKYCTKGKQTKYWNQYISFHCFSGPGDDKLPWTTHVVAWLTCKIKAREQLILTAGSQHSINVDILTIQPPQAAPCRTTAATAQWSVRIFRTSIWAPLSSSACWRHWELLGTPLLW